MENPSRNRILFLLKTRGACTAGVFADDLAMTTMGVRQHLLVLERQGLVTSYKQRVSRGRPKKYWQLSAEGHRRFPDGHATLSAELLRSTRALFKASGLEQVIRHREQAGCAHYGSQLLPQRTLQAKVAALAALRDQEGYMASSEKMADGSFLLIENHCPILAAAAVCPSLCRSEHAVFQTVLGEDIDVERLDHVLQGGRRCAYRIRKIVPE